ncbi:MAG: hypothetical protein WB607_18495 [Candidatus Acidiferrum sp.]|jgi:DNA-binding transcriptional ArsR family regulator
MPAVSKHLRVLERAGLIVREREAQWRPCRLEAAPLQEVAAWTENYRRFFEESFDRLDEYLRELKEIRSKKEKRQWPKATQTLARERKEEERDFVISRLFDAPQELVFDAWTEPKHMAPPPMKDREK